MAAAGALLPGLALHVGRRQAQLDLRRGGFEAPSVPRGAQLPLALPSLCAGGAVPLHRETHAILPVQADALPGPRLQVSNSRVHSLPLVEKLNKIKNWYTVELLLRLCTSIFFNFQAMLYFHLRFWT